MEKWKQDFSINLLPNEAGDLAPAFILMKIDQHIERVLGVEDIATKKQLHSLLK
jgi:hypothetical protein